MSTLADFSPQRLLLLASAGLALLLPSCQGDGNFTILGYTTAPNYDRSIHTVRVPVFQNRTYLQGIEFDVTTALVAAIEARTPYKVVSGSTPADTELTGTLVAFNKYVLLPGPTNENRVGQAILSAEIVWRDLRTGQLLSRPNQRLTDMPLPDGVPDQLRPTPGLPQGGVAPPPPSGQLAVSGPAVDPNAPTVGPDGTPIVPPIPGAPLPPGVKPPKPMATLVRAQANYIPELGQSLGSANFEISKKMAVEIVGMMEKPW